MYKKNIQKSFATSRCIQIVTVMKLRKATCCTMNTFINSHHEQFKQLLTLNHRMIGVDIFCGKTRDIYKYV